MRAALRTRHEMHAAAFRPAADAVETLVALRTRGIRIGLLTNCTSDDFELWRSSELAALVDAAAFSAREGLMKPEPAFYRLLLSRLAIDPERCLDVGDGKDDELQGAAEVGCSPVLYAPHQAPCSWPGPTVRALREVPNLLPLSTG